MMKNSNGGCWGFQKRNSQISKEIVDNRKKQRSIKWQHDDSDDTVHNL